MEDPDFDADTFEQARITVAEWLEHIRRRRPLKSAADRADLARSAPPAIAGGIPSPFPEKAAESIAGFWGAV